jgi:UDP-glucose 4-epimerase
MEICVTGASGVIGTALCRSLSESNHDVVGVDSQGPRWDPGVDMVNVDLTETTPDNLPSADIFVHLAAHSRVAPVVEKPQRGVENVTMTRVVLDRARQTGAKIVLASSREVYGNKIKPDETGVDLDTMNPYAASKISSEALCNSYQRCFDVPVTILRLANVYGRYDLNPRVIPIFISLATAGKSLTVYGGEKVLDFLYIDDVVDVVRHIINDGEQAIGKTINLGSGVGTKVVQLAKLVVDRIDTCPGYDVEENRQGEVAKYITDISEAERLFDIEPTRLSETGLSQTIDWYQARPKLLKEIRSGVS